MSKWVDYLIVYEDAQIDFLSSFESKKSVIIKKITESASGGDLSILQSLVLELKILNELQQKFVAEIRERKEQINRNERKEKVR